MSQPVVSCAEWFVLGLNCQKAFAFLDKSYPDFKADSNNYKIQRHFYRRVTTLINEVMKALEESDDDSDNYETFFHKSAAELKFIYTWCQILEMQRRTTEDLPGTVVYEFGQTATLERYY